MSRSTARLLLPAAALLLPFLAWAAEDKEHAHHHDEAPATLTLNDGKKWQTDAPLREGMTGIRDAIQVRVKRIHSGEMTKAEFEALGAAIDKHVASIFSSCKLPPAADQNLHVVLMDVMDGTKILKSGEGERLAGVVKIIRALERYGQHFDHAGWKGVQH